MLKTAIDQDFVEDNLDELMNLEADTPLKPMTDYTFSRQTTPEIISPKKNRVGGDESDEYEDSEIGHGVKRKPSRGRNMKFGIRARPKFEAYDEEDEVSHWRSSRADPLGACCDQ